MWSFLWFHAKVIGKQRVDPQVVKTLRKSVRAINDQSSRDEALEQIDRFASQGLVSRQVAARYRAFAFHRTGELGSVIDLTDSRARGEQPDLSAFLLRLVTLLVADRYAVGQSDLIDALHTWLRDARLSLSTTVRLLSMIERYCAHAAVDDYWIDVFRRHASGSDEVAAFLQRHAAVKRNIQAAADVRIMSLGIHCLPWVLPNRWGLRTPQQLIELDSPFNLAGHDVSTLIRLFSTDFEGYTDPANIRLVTSAKGKIIPYNKMYRACFNHHRLPYWRENGFERLTAAINDKVENVRRLLRQPNLVLLVGNMAYENEAKAAELLRSLYSSIASRAVEPPLLIASTQRVYTMPPQIIRVGERIYHMNRPYPFPAYDWLTDLNSPAGLQFEGDYVSDVCSIVRGHGLWPQQA
jgi:hypothetical protein